jgi:hypothetical protein
MWTILSLLFFASIFVDIWVFILAIIGVILACVARNDEPRG